MTDDPKMPEPVGSVITASDFEGRVSWRRPGYQPQLRATLITTESAQAYAEALAEARVAQERERWTEAVMAELDGNGQAQAIVMYVTGQPPETGKGV